MLRFFAAWVLVLAWLSPTAAQDKRVALVIGNAKYTQATPMRTAVNDAHDIAAALARIGFAVTPVTDATREAMETAIGAFAGKARTADVAVVFYAGHAIELDGANWLVPVDGRLDSSAGATSSAVKLDRLIQAVAGAGQFGVVMVDAARDNPFAGSAQRTRQSAPSESHAAATDLLVAFATGAGQRPVESEARNSAFTAALLKHIATPGLELRRLMGRVRDDVGSATARKQSPFVYATLSSDRYLNPTAPR